jgi:hypothetical protein
VLSDFGVNIND